MTKPGTGIGGRSKYSFLPTFIGLERVRFTLTRLNRNGGYSRVRNKGVPGAFHEKVFLLSDREGIVNAMVEARQGEFAGRVNRTKKRG
jgi:hypothetical protein